MAKSYSVALYTLYVVEKKRGKKEENELQPLKLNGNTKPSTNVRFIGWKLLMGI